MSEAFVENYKSMFESRISVGAIEKLPGADSSSEI